MLSISEPAIAVLMTKSRHTSSVPPATATCPRWQVPLAVFLLAALTLVVFHRIVSHDFIELDDPDLLYQNPAMYKPLAQSLAWNWTHVRLRLYTPVPYDAWVLVAAVAKEQHPDGSIGLRPGYFHAASILVHIISAVLVFLLLREVISDYWPALLGAAVFAIHPLVVEPVAWASSLYTLMSGGFAFWALYHYVRYLKTSRENGGVAFLHQALSTLAFALAVLSKPTAASMVAGAIGFHLLLQQPLKRMRVLLAWLAIAMADYFIAAHFQPAAFVKTPLLQRPFVVADSISFYLQRIVWPINLIPDYGRWPAKVVASPSSYYTWIVSVMLLAILIVCIRQAPRIALGIFLILAGIFPFLGFLSFDFQWFSTVADRYAYLGMLGIAFLVATIAVRWKWTAWAFVPAIALLAITASSYAEKWRNSETLFKYTLTVRPDSLIAHKVLGSALVTQDPQAAEQHFAAALIERPEDPTANGDLAKFLLARGDIPSAEQHLRESMRVMPDDPRYHHDLGVTFAKSNRMEQAVAEFREAIRLAAIEGTMRGEYFQSLGSGLEALGQMEEAQAQWRIALQYDPDLERAKQGLERASRQTPSPTSGQTPSQ
jgi:tetratricopeptide (TPR) repeat protein